jgi:DDE superfamily endonuclease
MTTDLDLYTDYLISSFGQTSSTGLSNLLDKAISHDDVTRFLNQTDNDSKALWKQAKPLVRQIESDDGLLILDDSISEKPYTDSNGLVCPQYSHSTGTFVNGINFVSLLYRNKNVQLPIGFELVVKTLQCIIKTQKECWRSARTKNEMFRDLIRCAYQNTIKFAFILCDSWYVNSENINYILSIKKNLIGAIKSNLEVAISKEDRSMGKFVKISQVKLNPGDRKEFYIRSVTQPVLICKDVFTNKDNSQGELFLLCTDLTKSYQFIISTYQERWGIEDYHKSLKNNTSLQKSPTRTIQTQKTHFFASLCAYIKLEKLKINEKLNHFALKGKLYIKAIQTAFQELQVLKEKNKIIFA